MTWLEGMCERRSILKVKSRRVTFTQPSSMTWSETNIHHQHIYTSSYHHSLLGFFSDTACFIENKIDCELLRTGCCALAKFEVEKEEYLEYLDDKKSRVESLRTTMGLWTPEECAERLFASKCTSGLYQSLAGQFWPRKAVFGIAQLVLSRGVNIRTNTCLRSVKRPQSTGGHFALDSDAGPITCHKLVHATNGYAASLIPQYKGILVPVRGQVVATSPVSSFWIPHNLSLNDGYEYLVHRKLDKRIIYGGMRWRAQTAGKEVGVCDDSTIDETVSECLKTSLIEIFPLLKNEPNFKIDYEWTGVMGYSCDNYPLIGQVEAGCDEWIAAGYSGNGMPQCFGAAKAVSEMITGRLPTGDKWIPLFNPRRFNNPEYASKYRYTGSKHLKMEE